MPLGIPNFFFIALQDVRDSHSTNHWYESLTYSGAPWCNHDPIPAKLNCLALSPSASVLFFYWKKLLFYGLLFFEMEETPILWGTSHYSSTGRKSHTLNHYSSKWRKLQFYESLFFEVDEILILRIIILCDAGNSNSTNHYSSRLGKLQFYESLPFRDWGNSHSTNHYSSSWRKL